MRGSVGLTVDGLFHRIFNTLAFVVEASHLAESRVTSMSHTARTYASWISVLVVVAITSSCVTWLYVPREPRGFIINGTTMDRMLRAYQNVSRKAYGLFKVDRNENNSVAYDNKSKNEQDHLTWAEEFQNSNLILDPSRKWIIVEERGVYLIYLQVTYTSKIVNTLNSDTLNLELFVDFNYTEGKQEFSAAFDTQKLTENTQEAHLSIFFLLHMNPKEKLAVRAYPVDKISNDNTRPISSYITIVRYADW